MIFLFFLIVFSLQRDFCYKKWKSKKCEKRDKLVYQQYIDDGVCFFLEEKVWKYTTEGEEVVVKVYDELLACQSGDDGKEMKRLALNKDISDGYACEKIVPLEDVQSFLESISDIGENELVQKVFSEEGCDGEILSALWRKVDRETCAFHGVKDCDSKDGQSVFNAACDVPPEVIAGWEKTLLYFLLMFSIVTIVIILVLCFTSVIYVFIRDRKRAEEMKELTQQEDVWSVQQALLNVRVSGSEEETEGEDEMTTD